MAAPAEQLPVVEPHANDVIVMPEMPQDQLAQQRAKRLMRASGFVAVASVTQEQDDQQPSAPRNLLEAIYLAEAGDPNGIKMLDQNIEADFMERSFKAGLILRVELQTSAGEGLGQHGQSLDSVNGNSLRFIGRTWQMRERLKAEARNKYRQDMAHEMGLLEDNYLVVFSCVPDDMTRKELIEEDFFVDTMSCAIQATTEHDGAIELESAFVAGVKQPDAERHDINAVRHIAKKLGFNFDSKSTTQMLDSPVLIPKRLMPNGVVDLAALFDEPQGTFFGEDKPQEDYLAHREFWRQRQKKFKPMIQSIRRQLIAERHTFKTPTDATERLGKLSEQEGIYRAVVDKSINPFVFGPTSADYIEQARMHNAHGNTELAQSATRKALDTAKSSSCPGAYQKDKITEEKENDQNAESSETETSDNERICCPNCREYVTKKDARKGDCLRCPSCKYEVNVCTNTVNNPGKAIKPKDKANIYQLFGTNPAKNLKKKHVRNDKPYLNANVQAQALAHAA
ncbi:MAG: hypothetical protein V4702_05615 [Patescibacteria group bacterium]